jgi:hypothetical protein
MELTDAQHRLLSAAARHPQGLVAPPRLPPAARQALVHSLLTRELLAEGEAPLAGPEFLWRGDALGRELVLHITAAGLAAIGARLPVPPPLRVSLREAVRAVLAAWDDPDHTGLPEAIAAVRAILGRNGEARQPGQTRAPREGTRQQAVLELLRREQGATIAQVIEATGWQSHTVRGFLAGLKRKGMTVDVLERVRQVGPDTQGSRGSYSIYRIAAADAAASLAEAG